VCAQPFDQVNIDENPAFPRLGSGDFTRARPPLHRVGVHVQQFGGGVQVEGFHNICLIEY
jgi:hypothetical protein